MRSILLTGGAGFIGLATANALLAAGHRVRVLDMLDPQVHGPHATRPARLAAEVEFRHGDVRDAEAMARALDGIDTLYHFAALTGTAQSAYDSRRYVDVNGGGTALLWDLVVNRRLPLERVILASSRAIYGEGAYDCAACGRVAPPARGPAQLDAGQWEPACPHCGGRLAAARTPESHVGPVGSVYACTKALQEQLCRHGSDASGVPTIILRYFNVIGPWQSMRNAYSGIASVFCSRLLAGATLQLYEDGAIERDFIAVSDIVRANLLALALPRRNTCLNIGSGRAFRIADLAGMLCDVLGVEPRFEITGFSRLGDIRRCIADPAAAAQAMGFRAETDLPAIAGSIMRWAQMADDRADGYDAMLAELDATSVLRRSRAP